MGPNLSFLLLYSGPQLPLTIMILLIPALRHKDSRHFSGDLCWGSSGVGDIPPASLDLLNQIQSSYPLISGDSGAGKALSAGSPPHVTSTMTLVAPTKSGNSWMLMCPYPLASVGGFSVVIGAQASSCTLCSHCNSHSPGPMIRHLLVEWMLLEDTDISWDEHSFF